MRGARSIVVLTLVAVLGLGLQAIWATADHGTGDDQVNMTHLANLPKDGTTNSDLAFWGNTVYAGNYHGFRIIDASDPRNPRVLSDFACRGAQGDVGVWDTGRQRLLFVSVDARQTRPACSEPDPTKTTGWEGVRIFDVTKPRLPRLLAAVGVDCGSHTHTVVPDAKRRRVLIYASSYPLTEQGVHADDPETGGSDEGSECAVHSTESIIEVPFSEPANARVINEMSVAPAIGCHDVGVHMGAKLAAAACLTEGQIWDISDPANPVIKRHILNPDIEIWHSGAFSNDASHAIFGDEEGGAAATHGCNNVTSAAPGAMWFYEVSGSSPLPADSFTQRRGQGVDVCTAHNYNVIPGLDRDVLASAFYTAGTGVVDFTDLGLTDPLSPAEIGYYDAAGIDGNDPAFTWSSYWYNGLVFANDIDRGVDIFRYTGPGTAGATRLGHLNPQTQELPTTARLGRGDDD
jgi:hypothetical protein